MRKWMFAAVMAALTASAGGCGVIRAIDQWKCDRFGCCMPGYTPRTAQPAPPTYVLPTAAPVATTIAPSPCVTGTPVPAPCSPASVPVIGSP